jgi:hypothetical protein
VNSQIFCNVCSIEWKYWAPIKWPFSGSCSTES